MSGEFAKGPLPDRSENTRIFLSGTGRSRIASNLHCICAKMCFREEPQARMWSAMAQKRADTRRAALRKPAADEAGFAAGGLGRTLGRGRPLGSGHPGLS